MRSIMAMEVPAILATVAMKVDGVKFAKALETVLDAIGDNYG